MRILVTGGAGFIGSHLVERLLKEEHEVVCLDNFDPYYDPVIKRGNLLTFRSNPRFSLIEGDILEERLLSGILEDIDYIFHEAAQAGVRVSVEDPRKVHDVNITGTLNILKAALDSNVKKIVNASSSSVYGRVKYLPFDEEHPNEPISPYGVSKLAAEHYCNVFSEVYGLKTVSLRYFTVYGPRMRPDLAINIFLTAALRNKSIRIFGDGSKTRDFTYIDDIIEANIIALRKGEGVYNIGGGNRVSISGLAEKAKQLTGSDSEIIYSDSMKGDVDHTQADIRKAERELGWIPRINIDEGLRRYAEWMLSCL